MTTANTTNTTAQASKMPTDPAARRGFKKRLKREANKKRDLKLQTDKEFAKTFFDARSKRSTDKKSSFRKKKSKKK